MDCSGSTRLFVLGSLLAAVISLTGCMRSDQKPAYSSQPEVTDAAEDRPLNVVATYSILGDWIQTIGGDQIKLKVLVGAEGDAHTYEPTPQDSLALAEADIIFENGLGFEIWLDRLFQASQSQAKRVVVTNSIQPRELVVSDSLTEVDPHVWHLPENAMLMVEAITAALEQADPVNAHGYRHRHQAYQSQLTELDEWISKQTATVPQDHRKLVTTHDTFGYFADAYGFEVLSVLGSVSSETFDPSAGQIADTIDRIRSLGIPAIFIENILNPSLTIRIAEESGVRIVHTLYTDALGSANSPADSYMGMMRYNVKTIVEALQ